MAAADITTEFNEAALAREDVLLEVTDGETYVSRMSKPKFCHLTIAEDAGAETHSPSYTISGRTITIYSDGLSNVAVMLSVYGKLA